MKSARRRGMCANWDGDGLSGMSRNGPGTTPERLRNGPGTAAERLRNGCGPRAVERSEDVQVECIANQRLRNCLAPYRWALAAGHVWPSASATRGRLESNQVVSRPDCLQLSWAKTRGELRRPWRWGRCVTARSDVTSKPTSPGQTTVVATDSRDSDQQKCDNNYSHGRAGSFSLFGEQGGAMSNTLISQWSPWSGASATFEVMTD